MPVIVESSAVVGERLSTSWQVPEFTADPQVRMQWIEDHLLEGEGWLEGQNAYKNIAANMRVFDSMQKDGIKSTLWTNSLKYNIRKFVETIADLRDIGTYGSDAPQFKAFAEMENRVAKAIYLESRFPRQVRKMLQYAAVFGRGYLWPKVKAGDYGWGERRIIFEPLGLLDVIPVQIPSTNNVQDAYAVTAYEYMPLAEAHGRFPLFQSRLLPIDKVNLQSRLQARQIDYAERNRYGSVPSARKFGNLYCQIRYTWIRDTRINRSGQTIPMGDPGTSWFYKAPSVGMPIFGGVRNGMPVQRIAQPEDCRIYPYLRLMISSRGMDTPMYDGPNYDWHGKIPLAQLDVDDWAWEPIGRSLVQDAAPIEITKRKLERRLDQVIQITLNPPLGYDRTSTGGPKIEHFDIFEENVRVGADGKPKEVLQSILPEEVRPTAQHFQFIEYLNEVEKEQLGLNDLGSLANLKMNIASDTAEKALESIGPIAKSIAANVEGALADVAEMLKTMIPQWFDTKRIIEYIGPDNVTPEVYDFDPASLIPSHMPDEMTDGEVPLTASYYSRIDRARRYAANLRLTSVPSTLLKITQMQEQMKYLQLSRGGFPISNATVAKKLDIANYGEVPGATEREKWMNEQIDMLKFKAAAAHLAAQLMPQQPDDGGDGGGGGKGSAKAGGRKPSGKNPPKLEQKGGKGGNPRTVVTES
jgi:hypothetical protein